MFRSLFTAGLIGYLGAQALASVSDRPLYPFNSYRMFSKKWQDGIGMLEFRIRAENGQSYRPWELLRVPFFQANRIVQSATAPRASAALAALCSLLLDRSHSQSLVIEAEGVRYRRDKAGSRPMRAKVEMTKEIARCAR